ncbi:GPW/gp25 family protein [Nocardia sp. NBC_00508]|uniref:GPW/gp25 family protein n=1 Tax=Nocardia sp. NBC_00508 TaxID=2975992 RepID=UPI002E81ED19|nr:GPW/gp25 family protein [Nocardia sp. NBC_00508]WUD66787.1 GPW/gp25 family protein [Nocardia sp. NBC_00508]
MSAHIDPYGRAAAFPPMFTDLGGLAEAADVDILDQSIRVVLGTSPGERAMRPDFGCDLHSLAFAPNNPATANLARLHVESALSTWEPRIDLVGVDVVNDVEVGALVVTVRYHPRGGSALLATTFVFSLGGLP